MDNPARGPIDHNVLPPAMQQKPMPHPLPRQPTVRDYLVEDLNGLNPGIVTPEIEATHFELKTVMFNMLNTIGQFGGSATEDARQHLKSFMEVCNSFKIQGAMKIFYD